MTRRFFSVVVCYQGVPYGGMVVSREGVTRCLSRAYGAGLCAMATDPDSGSVIGESRPARECLGSLTCLACDRGGKPRVDETGDLLFATLLR